MLKKIRYRVEGLAINTAFLVFGLLPYTWASACCGWLFRHVGPCLGRTRIARSNLVHAFPGCTEAEIEALISDMWNNLGRVFGEFPHIGRMTGQDFAGIVTVTGAEHIQAAREGQTGTIFFSGHFANWELAPKTLAVHGCPLALVYRKGNNPALDRLIQDTRGHYQSAGVPKGASGARQLIRALKEKRPVGMLLDQKMNTGIPVPFFGREAMTATAIASLALRFGCQIIPVQVFRTGGVYHQVVLHPPLAYEKTGDEITDVNIIMNRINTIMEDWIRQHPAQWIWVHNRWPKPGDSPQPVRQQIPSSPE